VLVAPDGSAFAGVDTFGEAAMLRLRTELDDASIVETVGVQQEGAIRPRRGDPFASMTSAATEDHSIRLVRDPSPAVVTAEHRYHVLAVVTERGAQPVRHSDRDQALRLATRAVDHVSRVQARIQSMLRWVVVGLVIPLGLLLLWWELGSDMSVTSALLLDMLLFAAVVLVLMPVMVVLSRWHGWRPPLLTKR
jgi:hypothetical protein